jgi:branched-chain amino acid transport system substrate-binding protein
MWPVGHRFGDLARAPDESFGHRAQGPIFQLQAFVAAYEFDRAPSVQSAAHYAGCQLLVDAIRRTGGCDSENLREALLTLRTKTVFGAFAVDERGHQTAHQFVTSQWQDGRKVVVWPDAVATAKARLPTPMR